MALAPETRGNDIGLTIDDEADVAEETFVEDCRDTREVVAAARRIAAEFGAAGEKSDMIEGRGTRNEGRRGRKNN